MRAVNDGVAQDKLAGEGLLRLKLTAVEHENHTADGLLNHLRYWNTHAGEGRHDIGAIATSSKPMTDTAPGVATPFSCSCLMAPIAMSSLLATSAVNVSPRVSN